jgi:anti-anti-sigma factor
MKRACIGDLRRHTVNSANTSTTGTAGGHPATVEVTVRGDLDAWSASRVNYALEEALAQRPEQLIIDLTDCPSIDAAGIILLLDAHRRAMHIGGAVALRSPSAKLRRNLQLAHVDRVLQVIAPDTGSATSAS